jgi:predicted transcriptional regulator of viral defense system
MKADRTISQWVYELPRRGHYSFTQKDVFEAFPDMSKEAVRAGLYRQVAKGQIRSVWHGFFVVMLHEYGLSGNVPPTEYINQLMAYLGRNYYVALLSAASFHGSSHQAPQTFMVITDGGTLRSGSRSGSRIKFFTRKEIPKRYLDSVQGRSSYIAFSNRELTALDLVTRMKEVGGLSRAAEVIDGLAEEGLDFSKAAPDFYTLSPVACYQRLGYILDEVLGYHKLADDVHNGAIGADLVFSRTALSPTSDKRGLSKKHMRTRWKLIVNAEVDLDRDY